MYIERYKSVFTTYIDKLSLNNSVKDLITDDQFINNNPEFYLYYPALFSKYFNVSQEKLDLLCIAGYLYYQATIFLDKVIDDKNT